MGRDWFSWIGAGRKRAAPTSSGPPGVVGLLGVAVEPHVELTVAEEGEGKISLLRLWLHLVLWVEVQRIVESYEGPV